MVSGFWARFQHNLHLVDPRMLAPKLFFGLSLEDSIEILSHNPSHSLALRIVGASTHPDTGAIIPEPFRMCGFVPFGTPITIGLLLSTHSLPLTLFWQVANQSHNSAINYFNRNASSEYSNKTLLQAFIGSVTSASILSFGLLRLFKDNPVLSKFLPFPTVAAANAVNLVFMRSSELSNGVDVFTPGGEFIDKSLVAGQRAVLETAISRIILPMPMFIFAPLMISKLNQLRVVQANPRLRLATTLVSVVTAFQFGLPYSMSLFEQYGKIALSDLEPDLQKKVRSTTSGADIPHVIYNKGL